MEERKVYRRKGDADDRETESDRRGVCGVRASGVPGRAGRAEYERRAEDLDQDRLRSVDPRMDDGHAMAHRRVRVAVVEQLGRSDDLLAEE